MSITEIESFRLSRRGFLNAAALGAAGSAFLASITLGLAIDPPHAGYATAELDRLWILAKDLQPKLAVVEFSSLGKIERQ